MTIGGGKNETFRKRWRKFAAKVESGVFTIKVEEFHRVQNVIVWFEITGAKLPISIAFKINWILSALRLSRLPAGKRISTAVNISLAFGYDLLSWRQGFFSFCAARSSLCRGGVGGGGGEGMQTLLICKKKKINQWVQEENYQN